MTRGSPSKTPVVHQINFHKLNEINRESALAAGTKDWAPVHSVTVGGVDIDLQMLYSAVKNNGGYEKVTNSPKGWKNVVKALEGALNQDASLFNLNFFFKHAYEKHLALYEKVVDHEVSLQKALEELKAGAGKYDDKAASAEMDNEPDGNASKKAKLDFTVIEHSEFSKHVYRGANPDDDGKDEKYLSGGFSNRLTLAIKSTLPNEQDWALNKLIKLTYQHQFYIGYLPGLPEALLDLSEDFFGLLRLNTSPKNFETSLVDGAKSVLPDINNPLFVNTEKGAMLIERALQVLHIFRNLSFMNENAAVFVRDHRLLTLLAKALAFPPSSYYTEIQQHALDIFENIAYLVQLRGPSDFYLACLLKHVFGSDKARILGAIKSLIKLTMNEKNEKIMVNIDTPLIQRLLQLLLVPDEDLALNILEFFYLFTNLSPDAGLRIASSVRFNVLKLLFKFVHWRSVGMEVYRSTIPHIAKKNESAVEAIAPPPKAPPPNLPTTAIDHFHAAMWIQAVCEREPSSSSGHDEFYEKYTEYCSHYELQPIMQMELLKLIVKIVSESAVSSQPPLILGLRPKKIQRDVEMATSPSATPSLQSPSAATKQNQPPVRAGNFCGFPSCQTMADPFKTTAELWEHVLATHSPLSATTMTACPWNQCKAPIKSPRHFLSHLKTHIIPEPVVSSSSNEKEGASSHNKTEFRSVPASAIQFHLGEQNAEELKGIPLTALLILRNMAKNPENHKLFAPYEQDLACLLTSARYGKTVCSVFAELR